MKDVKQYLNCRGAAGRRLPPSRFSIPPSRFRCPPSRFERWIIRRKRSNFSSKFDKKKTHFNFRRRPFFWSLLSSVASQGYSPPPPPPPLGLSTKMQNKENTTFSALLSQFFLCWNGLKVI